jgi:Flp pilus assembly pilin Flp
LVDLAVAYSRSWLRDRWTQLRRAGELGATAAEYALLVALIAVAIIVGAQALGTQANDKLQCTADSVETSADSCP